jgi:hypothetical protein
MENLPLSKENDIDIEDDLKDLEDCFNTDK